MGAEPIPKMPSHLPPPGFQGRRPGHPSTNQGPPFTRSGQPRFLQVRRNLWKIEMGVKKKILPARHWSEGDVSTLCMLRDTFVSSLLGLWDFASSGSVETRLSRDFSFTSAAEHALSGLLPFRSPPRPPRVLDEDFVDQATLARDPPTFTRAACESSFCARFLYT